MYDWGHLTPHMQAVMDCCWVGEVARPRQTPLFHLMFPAVVTKNGPTYLEKYDNRGLVFEDAFNVTRYAFRLATFVVYDDGGGAFPVHPYCRSALHRLNSGPFRNCEGTLKHRITARQSSRISLFKKTVPYLDAHFVMKDDTYVFYYGFAAVIPLSRAGNVLCAFLFKNAMG
ncbi:hypothetical protein V3C99_004989 [Haemonchus contortus]